MSKRNPFAGGGYATQPIGFWDEKLTDAEATIRKKGLQRSAKLGKTMPRRTYNRKPVEMAVQTEPQEAKPGLSSPGWPGKVAAAIVTERLIDQALDTTARRVMPTLTNPNADQNFNDLYVYMAMQPTRVPVLPESLAETIKGIKGDGLAFDKEAIRNDPINRAADACTVILRPRYVPGVKRLDDRSVREVAAVKIQANYRGYRDRKVYSQAFGRKTSCFGQPFVFNREPFVYDLIADRATSKPIEASKLSPKQADLIKTLRNWEAPDDYGTSQSTKPVPEDRGSTSRPSPVVLGVNFGDLEAKLKEIEAENNRMKHQLARESEFTKKIIPEMSKKTMDFEDIKSSVKKSRSLRWKGLPEKDQKFEESAAEKSDIIEEEIYNTARSSRPGKELGSGSYPMGKSSSGFVGKKE